MLKKNIKGKYVIFENKYLISYFFLVIILTTSIMLLITYSSVYQKSKPFISELENFNGNVYFHVINLYIYPEVDLQIYMNNKLILSKIYPVEGEHAYIKTVFKIEPELYQFRILSKNLNLEKIIDINLKKTPNILISIQRDSDNKPEFEVSLKAGRFYFI